jgi:2-polyprenyl-3-methyl-5-hydroxy-6-metoxy-1,4-benzoquinol methylase
MIYYSDISRRYLYQDEINFGVLNQIPDAANSSLIVLDVGCGTAALSAAIEKKGYSVWGIEKSEDAARIARPRIANVISADSTDFETVLELLGEQRFDFIVFSDILEHLVDPFSVLKFYLSFLNQGGYLIVSVPNAVVWTNRFSFLFGRFEYRDSGVMDRTHLRFFTFRSAKRLVRFAGCNIVKVDYTPYLIRAFLPIIKKFMNTGGAKEGTNRRELIDSPMYSYYIKLIYPVEYVLLKWWKSLFAFRIIIVGSKS